MLAQKKKGASQGFLLLLLVCKTFQPLQNIKWGVEVENPNIIFY